MAVIILTVRPSTLGVWGYHLRARSCTTYEKFTETLLFHPVTCGARRCQCPGEHTCLRQGPYTRTDLGHPSPDSTARRHCASHSKCPFLRLWRNRTALLSQSQLNAPRFPPPTAHITGTQTCPSLPSPLGAPTSPGSTPHSKVCRAPDSWNLRADRVQNDINRRTVCCHNLRLW